MSDQLELQAEEREALEAIYEGDVCFKEIEPIIFQYKYGEDNHYKSFLVEVKWGENYPAEVPTIKMDTFYNSHLVPAVKKRIHDVLLQEAELWLGSGMTYTLFECVKDRLEELTADQPEHGTVTNALEMDNCVASLKISDVDNAKQKEPKKEQLTKAQKRRQWERTDHKGDRPRGWNWVDIVKHLSQTGGKDSE